MISREALSSGELRNQRGTRIDRADYGIVTALTDELTAVLEQIEDCEEVTGGEADRRYYYRGTVPCLDGSTQSVVCVGTNGMGQQAALNATRDLLAAWHPRHILLVGIAGGIASRGVSYGDLIIPRFVHYYEPGKLTSEGTRYRTRSFEPSLALQPAADALNLEGATRAGEARWAQAIRVPRPDGTPDPPRVHREELATGEQVWADLEAPVVRDVLAQHEKVVGIENEAAGVFNAVREATEHADVLVVKAASDLVEGKDDTWRAYAAAAAAAYARALIERVGARWDTGGTESITPSTPGVLTFLIADVRGYTRFTLEHGDEAAAALAGRFAELCEESVSAHGGQVIELRGDEALAAFPSARNALRAAVDLQGAFGATTLDGPSVPLKVGIGLDAGEAVAVKGGYRGGALNLAARLCSIAGPGEVFASETVIGLARNLEGITLVDRGAVDLKGFTTPVRVVQVAPEGEISSALPPLQPMLVTHPNNLPDDPTPFIGREQEIAWIAGMLRDPQIRMVTLTGPGGTGKTRLALQVGHTLLHDFPGGVFFVNLAPIFDPARVPSAIASVLGVKEDAGTRLVETLATWLRDKRLLLVLDNYEHLLDAASVAASLLDACRELHILVTSRITLHLTREHEHGVPPLAVPDPHHLPDLEALSQYESVALFVERARAAKDSFSVTNDNAPAVAEICSRLDGLPLAIELAAARIKLFPPQALLQRLSSRLKVLTGGAKDRPRRQQTLRGAIDWSYSLLSEEEQVLFARLSVFAGGWTFETAQAVCDPDGELDFLDGMTSLVDKSLIRQEGEEEPRFFMLETIREYAADKLAAQGDEAEIQGAHAGFMLALAEEARPSLDRRLGTWWLERLTPERDNLRVAFRWLLQNDKSEEAARLVTSLWGFWRSSKGVSWVEGRQQLETVLARPELTSQTRSRALVRLCNYLGHQGALDRQQEAADEALSIARDTGDMNTQFEALVNLWSVAVSRGDRKGSRALAERCSHLASQIGDPERGARILRMQGFEVVQEGDFERAGQLFGEEVELRRNPEVAGDLQGALVNLGWAALQRGDLDTAEAAYVENGTIVGRQGLAYVALERGEYDAALRRFGEITPIIVQDHTLSRLASNLEAIAQIAAVQSRPVLAALLLGTADALHDNLGQAHELMASEKVRLDLARSALGEEAWATEYARGRALSIDDAVRVALQYADER